MSDNLSNANAPLLQVVDLKKHFPVQSDSMFGKSNAVLKAVDGVSFTIKAGETFGLVGESGCGKTTVGKTIIDLYQPTSGQILWEGVDTQKCTSQQKKDLRCNMQMIFQDPYSSLNPRMTIERTVLEPLLIQNVGTKEERQKRVAELLDIVGLPSFYAKRYPHELSGGQRQRVGIARALALRPKMIICDEPVSALDVSIQSKVLNLLKDLRDEFNLSYLFIAHGMPAVRFMSDRIGVMYLGKLVEVADRDTIYNAPKHPYSQALMSAIPVTDPEARRSRIVLQGDIPSPINPPSGCAFCTRCMYAEKMGEICTTVAPELKDMGNGHMVACHMCNNNEK
jgi:oligopeptide/dipeptide ABC transporter ATP-binding protein